MRKLLLGLVLLSWGTRSEAGLFLGPATFTAGPTSQLGPTSNSLVITNTANGFVVSGSVVVTLPPTVTPHSGTLVTWIVDRPLDPAYGSGTLTTTTIMNGSSSPPIGAFLSTNGSVFSEFSNVGSPSVSSIPLSLVNGIDTPPWTSLTMSSSLFSYTSGPGNVLRQEFQLDGIYQAGPGGSWTISVPVTTFATIVPEPSSLVSSVIAVVVVGFAQFCRTRRSSRA